MAKGRLVFAVAGAAGAAPLLPTGASAGAPLVLSGAAFAVRFFSTPVSASAGLAAGAGTGLSAPESTLTRRVVSTRSPEWSELHASTTLVSAQSHRRTRRSAVKRGR